MLNREKGEVNNPHIEAEPSKVSERRSALGHVDDKKGDRVSVGDRTPCPHAHLGDLTYAKADAYYIPYVRTQHDRYHPPSEPRK